MIRKKSILMKNLRIILTICHNKIQEKFLKILNQNQIFHKIEKIRQSNWINLKMINRIILINLVQMKFKINFKKKKVIFLIKI